jgi:hypothetical protein
MTIDREALPDRAVITVEFSGLDQAAIAEMARATGEPDPANLVRAALWRYGEHLGMRFPVDVFVLRRPPATRRRRAE